MDAESPTPASPTNVLLTSEHESVPGIANGSISTLNEAINRLASAIEGNPEDVDVPAHSKSLDSASKHLLAAAAMVEHRSLRKQGKGKGKVPDKITPDMAVKHGVGLGSITPIGIANLYSRFNQLDTDESSSLSIPEIERMMLALGLYNSQKTLDTILSYILTSDDKSAKIDWETFVTGMEKVISDHFDPTNLSVHLPDVPVKRLQEEQMKVGFGGTSWRPLANAQWILTNCGVIAVSALAMSGIIYFRFMLVPMTMAYFLTFVLGPMIDFLSQRPLVCFGRVYCKIKKLPYDKALTEWRKEHPTRPMPEPSDVEYPFDNSVGRMCHSVPPSKVQGVIAELIAVGQMPFPLALTMMFSIVCATLYVVFAFVQRDLNLVLSDPIFVASLKDVLNGLLRYLKNDIGVILDMNVEELLPPPCYPNDADWVEAYPNHLDCERMSNISAVRFEGTTDEFLVFLAPYISLANDWVLTIMLCLYLLAARSGRTEYDHHRAKHAVGELSIMEKIEVMNKNYVLLKSKLSALTGGLVGIILGLLGVKLWFIWALLTFMLNFIPNVGSMLAMVLPIPIIIVDDELEITTKLLAFALPAFVQLYVGNVLEPMVFGKSLNLTALSVLVALVLWSSIWGMSGAILSVPLLGVMKILLDAADFPLAKMLLVVIREDSDINEHAQMSEMLKQLPSYQMENTYSLQSPERSKDEMDNPLAHGRPTFDLDADSGTV